MRGADRKRKNLIQLGIEQGQAYAWKGKTRVLSQLVRLKNGGMGSSPKSDTGNYHNLVKTKTKRV